MLTCGICQAKHISAVDLLCLLTLVCTHTAAADIFPASVAADLSENTNSNIHRGDSCTFFLKERIACPVNIMERRESVLYSEV